MSPERNSTKALTLSKKAREHKPEIYMESDRIRESVRQEHYNNSVLGIESLNMSQMRTKRSKRRQQKREGTTGDSSQDAASNLNNWVDTTHTPILPGLLSRFRVTGIYATPAPSTPALKTPLGGARSPMGDTGMSRRTA